jgi:outer membrane protein OmpA-like peptidoglycan-associated protein
MKRYLFFSVLVFFAHAPTSHAQIDESGKSYYVVIGAFSYEQNARDFIQWTSQLGLNPQYKLNAGRKLFYVFTRQDSHWGIPVMEAEKLRKFNPKLDETWVYYGMLDVISPEVKSNEPQTTPATTVVLTTSEEKKIEPIPNETPVQGEEKIDAPVNNTRSTTPAEIDNAKRFLFKLYGEDGKSVKAPIEVIDLDKSSMVGIFPSNEKVAIKPINESGRIMIQSKVFGYRLKQIGVDFNNPTDSAGIVLDSGIYQVPLELKQLVEGDVTIMYNVFFYKDAGIMRPDSKYEVNALVAMMQEFPNRKIIIHGHTNGSHRGKIIKIGPDKNFFSLTGSTTYIGSATELSKVRAETIEEYLILNGIEKSRMSVKAWGGKKPLFHHESDQAIENVRVEIEIAKN